MLIMSNIENISPRTGWLIFTDESTTPARKYIYAYKKVYRLAAPPSKGGVITSCVSATCTNI